LGRAREGERWHRSGGGPGGGVEPLLRLGFGVWGLRVGGWHLGCSGFGVWGLGVGGLGLGSGGLGGGLGFFGWGLGVGGLVFGG
jgi:hypothetical protein